MARESSSASQSMLSVYCKSVYFLLYFEHTNKGGEEFSSLKAILQSLRKFRRNDRGMAE